MKTTPTKPMVDAWEERSSTPEPVDPTVIECQFNLPASNYPSIVRVKCCHPIKIARCAKAAFPMVATEGAFIVAGAATLGATIACGTPVTVASWAGAGVLCGLNVALATCLCLGNKYLPSKYKKSLENCFYRREERNPALVAPAPQTITTQPTYV
jgi:hypothetical protein